MATKLVLASVETTMVPSPVEYAVLLPEDAAPGLPLLLFLHGGGGSRAFLENSRALIEEMWARDVIPPMVVATPSVGRSFYMDYRDGSQKWETFILEELRSHLADAYGASRSERDHYLMGISMGGMGGLRLGLKYPERFGAVVALEPGVDPAHRWEDVPARAKFWRGPALMESLFGSPFDSEYWTANNPATIAMRNAEAIIAAGLPIYIEAGDEDWFNLHEATEFLHRVLWDAGIKHEYHLVRGANHVGRTVPPRMGEGFEFLGRVLRPDTSPDPAVEDLERRLGEAKRRFS
jgi:S-formylglutathione hydrolase